MDILGGDPQSVFNIIVSAIVAGCGWMVRSLQDTLKDLQKSDERIANKVNNMEVLVAGSYVTRDYFQDIIKALFKKVDDLQEDIKVLIREKADK
jgi:hypothetical protein